MTFTEPKAEHVKVIEGLWQVLGDVAQERLAQRDKWGQQSHHPLIWLGILGEEYGEVAKEVVDDVHTMDAGYLDRLRMEVIQLAAVAVAFCESIDRRGDPDADDARHLFRSEKR